MLVLERQSETVDDGAQNLEELRNTCRSTYESLAEIKVSRSAVIAASNVHDEALNDRGARRYWQPGDTGSRARRYWQPGDTGSRANEECGPSVRNGNLEKGRIMQCHTNSALHSDAHDAHAESRVDGPCQIMEP